MRKLLDNRFLLIMASTLIVLIILVLGVFVFFKDKGEVFVKEGYILDNLSSSNNRYYFDKDTSYKENLSSKIVFKDTSKEEVQVIKDSFVHYLDGSISFLKNGAILDLGTVKSSIANFYNITKDSVLEYKDKGYYIESTNGVINFNNLIARISDNKYMVAGKDVKLKVSSSDSSIDGDYFEIVYVEKGIVNIENQEVKYQVPAENSFIYVGDITIDLGNKKILSGDTDIMSITTITIDGNENIEIIPKDKYKDDDKDKDKENDNKDGNKDGTNGGTNGNGNGGTTTDNNNPTDGNGNKENDGNSDVVPNVVDNTKISLVNAEITSTSIGLTLDVNGVENADYKLYMTNTESGKRVYSTTFSGNGEKKIPTKYSLNPDTNYLVTIETSGEGVYQNIFKTKDMGVSINKLYAESDSLTFDVRIDKNSTVNKLTLNLYKYDEKNGEYVLQKDANGNNQSTVISKDNSLEGYNYTFKGLSSNTTYYVIAEDFNVNNIEYSGVYNISLKIKTLKEDISNNIIPKVTVNSRNNTFTLSLEGITDEEKSITSYTYYVYDAEDIRNGNPDKKPVINPITKTNAGNITLDVEPAGSAIHDPNKLENGKNYVYNVLIEYYDNEKYGEFLTVNSDEFWVSGKPSISISQDNDNTTYDKVVANIDLIDNSCTVPLSGRECYDEANEIRVTVTDRMGNAVFSEVVNFEKVPGNDKILRYNLVVDGLTEGSTYKVDVTANKVDMRDGNIYAPYTFTFEDGRSTLETKKLSELTPVFKNGEGGSNIDHVVNANLKFVCPDVEGKKDEVNCEYTASALKSIVVKLYRGDISGNLDEEYLVGEKVLTNNDFNLKETLYGDEAPGYNITTDETFGLTYEYLKENNILTEKYTIVVYAYYEDVSIYSDHLSSKEIKLTFNEKVYTVNPQLFMEEIKDPTSTYVKRSNSESGNMFPDVSRTTTVGFLVSSRFHRLGLEANGQNPTGATYYVYKQKPNGTLEKVDFYIKDGDELKRISKDEGLKFNTIGEADSEGNVILQAEIFMDKGTDLTVSDDLMRRGNIYFVSCEIKISNSTTSYPYNSSSLGNKPYTGLYGIFTEIAPTDSSKQNPTISMYALSSTKNSITYNYKINDIDKVINSESGSYKIYYTKNDGSEVGLDITPSGNGYSGTYTIDNLSNNDTYNIYLKENLIKTDEASNDVLMETMFDGYYDIKDYNNKFEILNKSDNRVKFKMLLDSDVMDRVLSYKVVLTDSKDNKLEIIKPSLESCYEDNTDSFNRCINIDYTDLKKAGMQTTDTSKPNNIKVDIYGYYDTGIIKWVDSPEDNLFYIFQDNNTKEERGNYIVFSSSGVISSYNPSEGSNTSVRTHYTYKRNTNDRSLVITNKYAGYNISSNTTLKYVITSSGIKFALGDYNKLGSLNSKVVKEGSITSSDNQFNFSSITPKISKNSESALINGANVTMTINGFDESSFKKENDKFYFYIDVWNSEEDYLEYKDNWNSVPNIEKNTKILRTVKYEYDPESGNKFKVLIDGLDASTSYYYTVSAYMKNGKYTQFFDGANEDEYVTKLYTFSSGGSSFYQNLKTGYTSSYEKEAYGKRTLNSVISLATSSDELNFYLKYAVCDVDSESCDLNNHIQDLLGTVNKEDMSNSVKSSIDLPNDFVYGKNYMYKLYAIYDKKDQDGNVVSEGEYLLNFTNINMYILPLTEPSFTITRKASIDSEEGYVIDTMVKLNDPDATVLNKEFSMKITGGNSQMIMQIKDENGKWKDVSSDYKFDLTVDAIEVRFRNLEENTAYEVTASANSYRNNDSLEVKEEEITKSHTVYSTNSYGVALGLIDLSATPNSIVAKFLGGSSFEKVDSITYTIGIWGNSEAGSTIYGSYNTSDKPFQVSSDDPSTFRYVFNPEELVTKPAFAKAGSLIDGKTYTLMLDFKIGANNVTTDLMTVTYSKEVK